MRAIPRAQTLRMIIVASVIAATLHSAELTGAPSPPSMRRSPAIEADTPIMKITTPEISGGKIGRNRLSSGARAASKKPAKTVIPNTSGSPPSFAAISDGPR
jgi:hypothetical protein